MYGLRALWTDCPAAFSFPMILAQNRGLHRLSWPEAERAAAHDSSTIVVPWGSLEQHGPHLPLGTDGLFAEQVLHQVLQALPPQLPIWSLPLQSLGFAPEHKGFGVSFTQPAEVMLAQVEAIAEPLAQAGFQRLVLFNGHGGQISLLDAAARQVHGRHPQLGVHAWFLWDVEGVMDLIPDPERGEGLHAGLAETSLMLHVAPELVQLQQAVAEPPPTAPAGLSLEGRCPSAWTTRTLSRSGTVGTPHGATASLGAALHQKLVQGWIETFTTLLSSSWPPRRSPESSDRV